MMVIYHLKFILEDIKKFPQKNILILIEIYILKLQVQLELY